MSRKPVLTVDVTPFQARFHQLRAAGITACEIAARMGWMREFSSGHRSVGKAPQGDAGRLRRTIGLKATSTRGHTDPQRRVRYETALLLAEAMDLDLHEWDV